MSIPKMLETEDSIAVEELVTARIQAMGADDWDEHVGEITAYQYGPHKIRLLVNWTEFNMVPDHNNRLNLLDLPRILPKKLWHQVQGNALCHAPNSCDGPLMDMLWNAYQNPVVVYEKDQCVAIKEANKWADQRVAGAGCRIRRKVHWEFTYDPHTTQDGWKCELHQITQGAKGEHNEVWSHYYRPKTQEQAAKEALKSIGIRIPS